MDPIATCDIIGIFDFHESKEQGFVNYSSDDSRPRGSLQTI